jgi:2-(1,2-epoxy-1,2-dihydrophenyl)acetyl-CoA isomerase
MPQTPAQATDVTNATVLQERLGEPGRVVLRLTLNRPASLNALTTVMHGELLPALNAAAADPAVRAVIITGAGRGFCAGQDLADPAMAAGPDGKPADVGDVVERYYRPLATRVRSMPVPVLAAVNGVAAGAGANLALCCDMVVAARSASFIQAFSKIGLVPDCGGTWLLPRLVGRARALGLAMTADKLPAEEAARIGMIWQCVDDADLHTTTLALAHRLAAMPTAALVETRRLLDAAVPLAFEDAITFEAQSQGRLSKAADHKEGVAAFLGKRPAHFTDR